MSGVSHKHDLAVVENPFFKWRAIIECPTAGFVFHEAYQFLYDWMPALVRLKNFRLRSSRYPGLFLGRILVSRYESNNVQDAAICRDGISEMRSENKRHTS